MVCEHGLTWIKPPFLWMMYRCGWATKPGQETVLDVAITLLYFQDRACLRLFVPKGFGQDPFGGGP
jgi:hypothetical protein